MITRLVKGIFYRRPLLFLLGSFSVTQGVILTTAFLLLISKITESISMELRSFGANIRIIPKEKTFPLKIADFPLDLHNPLIDVDSLIKLKRIFWKNNITGYVPFLYGKARLQGREVILIGTWDKREISLPDFRDTLRFVAGLYSVFPDWEFPMGSLKQGVWLGRKISEEMNLRVGDTLSLRFGKNIRGFNVSGVIETNDYRDRAIWLDLEKLQELMGNKGKVSEVLVSALVKPDDELANRVKKNPDAVTKEEFETWFCSPYISSILYQIEEAIPNTRAVAIRKVSEREGKILSRLSFLFTFIIVFSVIIGGVGVSASASEILLEMRPQIALFRSIGAGKNHIYLFFYALFLLEAVLGFLIGVPAGLALAQLIGKVVLGNSIPMEWSLLPLMFIFAILLILIGTFPPLRKILKDPPSLLLREI